METELVTETGRDSEMNRMAQYIADMALLRDSDRRFCRSSGYQEAIEAFGHSVPLPDTNLLLQGTQLRDVGT
jgi:hypothetical protein